MRGGRRPQVQFKDLEVDYKDLDSLRQFVGDLALIPYTDQHK
jgi:ribosomal protein S18